MKRFFTSAAVFCGLSMSLFAHPHDGQIDNQSQSNTPTSMPMPHKWQQCMIDKDGWIEGGAEWLFLSSSLTPTFTREIFVVTQDPIAPNTGTISTGSHKSINPEYNSGFSLFFRYRGHGSDNDLTVNYSYLRNNGDGSYRRSASPVTQVTQAGTTVVEINNDDKGHLHSHMHVIDFMAGRQLPLTYQTILRLSGGLTFNDFFLCYQQTDFDQTRTFLDGTQTAEFTNDDFYKEHHRFWGLGPKGQVDFEYLMLPTSWNHSLNFSFWGQFALLFSKEWAHVKLRGNDIFNDFVTPANNFVRLTEQNLSIGADHLLIPNINLDFGLKYRWESSFQNIFFNLAIGYRVWAYWNLDNLFSGRQRLILGLAVPDPTFVATQQNLDNIERLIYGGPYVRVSVAY